MLSASFFPRTQETPVYRTSEGFYWITWGGFTLHLYPQELTNITTFRNLINQFLQESLNAQSSLSNGDRLDNPRDVPVMPAEGL